MIELSTLNKSEYLEKLEEFLSAGKEAGYIDYLLIASPERISWRVQAVEDSKQ